MRPAAAPRAPPPPTPCGRTEHPALHSRKPDYTENRGISVTAGLFVGSAVQMQITNEESRRNTPDDVKLDVDRAVILGVEVFTCSRSVCRLGTDRKPRSSVLSLCGN